MTKYFFHPHVSIKKTGHGDEHRVNYKGGREETAYYSDSYDDAKATAKHMGDPERVMKEHELPHWGGKE